MTLKKNRLERKILRSSESPRKNVLLDQIL